MNQNKIKILIRCNKTIRRILIFMLKRKFCPYFIAKHFINFLWNFDDKEL